MRLSCSSRSTKATSFITGHFLNVDGEGEGRTDPSGPERGFTRRSRDAFPTRALLEAFASGGSRRFRSLGESASARPPREASMTNETANRTNADRRGQWDPFAYRRFGETGGAPLVFNQRFRGRSIIGIRP